ncbi:MAG: class I SAM-dependent methyltransferase [Ignavibacteria bacterium]|nr:class I SAM-dependent methyltransferase [Ignavibacteria bacterium]
MYKEISKYYNKIFPLNKEKVNFIENNFNLVNKKILDVGCATGELAIELSKKGFHVVGIDIDQDMINVAKSSAITNCTEVNFIVGDMLNMTEYFNLDEFCLVICWGNTIAHLNNVEEIKKFIKECYKVLRKDGQLSLQVVNYDRIVQESLFSLPEIDNENVNFKRNYKFISKSKLIFETEITIKETGEVLKNSTIHYPIIKEELIIILKESGFNYFRLYSDFKAKQFEEKDISLLINAIKV